MEPRLSLSSIVRHNTLILRQFDWKYNTPQLKWSSVATLNLYNRSEKNEQNFTYSFSMNYLQVFVDDVIHINERIYQYMYEREHECTCLWLVLI